MESYRPAQQQQYRSFYSGPPPAAPWGSGHAAGHPMGFFAPAAPPYYGGFNVPAWGAPPAPQHRPARRRGKQHLLGAVHKPDQQQQQQQRRSSQSKQRKHHQHQFAKGPTPRTVPPAPLHAGSFAFAQGLETPSMTPNPHGGMWRNTAPDLDQDILDRAREVGVDLFGAGGRDDPLLALGLVPREYGDDEEDMLGWSDGPDGAPTDSELEAVPLRLKHQLQSQAVYIAELEERNLHLEDKLYVLERELRQLREAARAEVSCGSTDHEGEGGDDARRVEVEQPALGASCGAQEEGAQEGEAEAQHGEEEEEEGKRRVGDHDGAQRPQQQERRQEGPEREPHRHHHHRDGQSQQELWR